MLEQLDASGKCPYKATPEYQEAQQSGKVDLFNDLMVCHYNYRIVEFSSLSLPRSQDKWDSMTELETWRQKGHMLWLAKTYGTSSFEDSKVHVSWLACVEQLIEGLNLPQNLDVLSKSYTSADALHLCPPWVYKGKMAKSKNKQDIRNRKS